jgi:inositol-phosphate phosphatase/L-galactose 1-phosphate phosphatase/histidinol-phosphatase
MPMSREPETEAMVQFVDAFAEEARGVALRYFRSNLVVDEKDDSTPVTAADREIEALFRERLADSFPTHGVIGEEFGQENADAEYVWVIDPIDGTKAFATGKPLFGTVVGLLQRGRPIVGLIDQAFTRERWIGVAGVGTTHNGAAVNVAGPRPLGAARFYAAAPEVFDPDLTAGFVRLRDTTKWATYNCDCYAYGLLALGHVDLVIERFLSLYDMAGVIPVIEGAGGFVSDWSGKSINADTDGTIVAACSEDLAREALDLLGVAAR